MAFAEKQIKIVEKVRRLSFADFDKIELSRGGVAIIANLFLNPDCITDVNLESYLKYKTVKLSDISRHIITAAPATLAAYAQSHNKLYLDRDDIVECFVLDHLQTLADNKIDKFKGCIYALAHTMSQATVRSVREDDAVFIVELEQGDLVYQNVIVPMSLEVKKGQLVWHHFGVVVDIASAADERIYNKQQADSYWQEIYNTAGKKNIDFTDKNIFGKNIYKRILQELHRRSCDYYENKISQSEIDRVVCNNSQINKIRLTN